MTYNLCEFRFYLTDEECKCITGASRWYARTPSFYLTDEECKFGIVALIPSNQHSFYLTDEECKFRIGLKCNGFLPVFI